MGGQSGSKQTGQTGGGNSDMKVDPNLRSGGRATEAKPMREVDGRPMNPGDEDGDARTGGPSRSEVSRNTGDRPARTTPPGTPGIRQVAAENRGDLPPSELGPRGQKDYKRPKSPR